MCPVTQHASLPYNLCLPKHHSTFFETFLRMKRHYCIIRMPFTVRQHLCAARTQVFQKLDSWKVGIPRWTYHAYDSYDSDPNFTNIYQNYPTDIIKKSCTRTILVDCKLCSSHSPLMHALSSSLPYCWACLAASRQTQPQWPWGMKSMMNMEKLDWFIWYMIYVYLN